MVVASEIFIINKDPLLASFARDIFLNFCKKRTTARIFSNGDEAMAEIERSANTTEATVVIITNLGKEGEGLALTKAIKNQEWGKKVFIIITTGGLGNGADEILEAGANVVMRMPIKNVGSLV